MLLSQIFDADELEAWIRFFNAINFSSSYIIDVADNSRTLSYEWGPVDVKQSGKQWSRRNDTLPDHGHI